jgi:hypothetical protein
MPLQIFNFGKTPLQFSYSETCHYNSLSPTKMPQNTYGDYLGPTAAYMYMYILFEVLSHVTDMRVSLVIFVFLFFPSSTASLLISHLLLPFFPTTAVRPIAGREAAIPALHLRRPSPEPADRRRSPPAAVARRPQARIHGGTMAAPQPRRPSCIRILPAPTPARKAQSRPKTWSSPHHRPMASPEPTALTGHSMLPTAARAPSEPPRPRAAASADRHLADLGWRLEVEGEADMWGPHVSNQRDLFFSKYGYLYKNTI